MSSEQAPQDPNVQEIPTKPVSETPRKPRYHAKHNQPVYRKPIGNHNQEEMIEVRDFKTFQDHYMPPPPAESVIKASIDFLERKKSITKAPHLWSDYPPGAIPKKPREEQYFQPLETICNKLLNKLLGEKLLKPNYQLHLQPNKTYGTCISGGTHKMDGTFLLRKSAKLDKPPLTSVGLGIEWKKFIEKNNVSENRTQLLTDTNFLMNNDPRRKFAFGLTIEESDCTVWYFSRSHLAKSKSFDWRTNIQLFLSVVLSFASATPEQLGFDPKITYIEYPRESFIYEVSDGSSNEKRYFHTQESISELRSTCITGRATHVWKAVEVSSPTRTKPKTPRTEVVLKDVWLDELAKTEKTIQVDIFTDVDSFGSSILDPSYIPPEFENLDPPLQALMRGLITDKEKYKQYFLTIICDSGLSGATSKSVPKDRRTWKAKHDVFDDVSPPKIQLASHPCADSTRSSQPHL